MHPLPSQLASWLPGAPATPLWAAALDLVRQLLTWSPRVRLTARQATNHALFDTLPADKKRPLCKAPTATARFDMTALEALPLTEGNMRSVLDVYIKHYQQAAASAGDTSDDSDVLMALQ